MTARDETTQLIARAKAGDRAAFDRLAGACQDRVRASLVRWSRFRIGPQLDLDDVLQETLLRAFRSLGRFEPSGDDAFCRWLCGVAKHALEAAIEESRRPMRVVPALEVDPANPDSGASPGRALARAERFERLEAALGKLGEEHRQVILLCRIEGLTSDEAAPRLGRSPAAVRQLLVRALKELKQAFGDTESLGLPPRRLGAGGDVHAD